MQPKTNVYGVLSLNFAIISIVISPCACGGLLFGIMALIFGIAGACKKDRPTGSAISGIIWSSIGIIISTAILLFSEAILAAVKSYGG